MCDNNNSSTSRCANCDRTLLNVQQKNTKVKIYEETPFEEEILIYPVLSELLNWKFSGVVDENDDGSKSANLMLCYSCLLILKDLYRHHKDFKLRRTPQSFVSNKIRHLETSQKYNNNNNYCNKCKRTSDVLTHNRTEKDDDDVLVEDPEESRQWSPENYKEIERKSAATTTARATIIAANKSVMNPGHQNRPIGYPKSNLTQFRLVTKPTTIATKDSAGRLIHKLGTITTLQNIGKTTASKKLNIQNGNTPVRRMIMLQVKPPATAAARSTTTNQTNTSVEQTVRQKEGGQFKSASEMFLSTKRQTAKLAEPAAVATDPPEICIIDSPEPSELTIDSDYSVVEEDEPIQLPRPNSHIKYQSAINKWSFNKRPLDRIRTYRARVKGPTVCVLCHPPKIFETTELLLLHKASSEGHDKPIGPCDCPKHQMDRFMDKVKDYFEPYIGLVTRTERTPNFEATSKSTTTIIDLTEDSESTTNSELNESSTTKNLANRSKRVVFNLDGVRRSVVPIKDPPYTCPFPDCEENVPDTIKNLKTLVSHLRNSHLQEEHTCPDCSRKFGSLKGLNWHLKSCGKQKGKNFMCEVCSKQFQHRSKLRDHQLVHQPERNFQCDQCGVAFKLKYNLNTHIRVVHTILDRRYVCELCGKGYKLSTRLKFHKRIAHTAEGRLEFNKYMREMSRKRRLNKLASSKVS